MGHRRFFLLAVVSLAVFIATAIARQFADGYPQSWTTLRWTDQGDSVSESVTTFGWYENGLQWIHVDAAAGPYLDPKSVEKVRTELKSVAPPGHRLWLRSTGFESFRVHANDHDFRLSKGSYIRSSFELTFDELAGWSAVLPALWILFQLVRGCVRFFPPLVRERRRCYSHPTGSRFGKRLGPAAHISFDLALAVSVLWGLSHCYGHEPLWSASVGSGMKTGCSIDLCKGQAIFEIVHGVQSLRPSHGESEGWEDIGSWEMPGFIYEELQWTSSSNRQFRLSLRQRFFVAYGLFAAIFAVLPLLWFIDVLRVGIPRHRRAVRGHCRTCGYDLTANNSGVCPECGTAITA